MVFIGYILPAWTCTLRSLSNRDHVNGAKVGKMAIISLTVRSCQALPLVHVPKRWL